MFPTKAELFLVPFNDQVLADEQSLKSDFWKTKDFFGVDVSCLYEQALKEKYQQPLIDTMTKWHQLCEEAPKKVFDFENCSLEDLMLIDWTFEHKINRTCLLHGYCLFFDAIFEGSDTTVILHTGPEHPTTHWYETKMMFEEPIGVNRTQVLPGRLIMKANQEQCFDCNLRVNVPAIGVDRNMVYDMKDPEYRGIYQYQ